MGMVIGIRIRHVAGAVARAGDRGGSCCKEKGKRVRGFVFFGLCCVFAAHQYQRRATNVLTIAI